jgi:hypothetical protein
VQAVSRARAPALRVADRSPPRDMRKHSAGCKSAATVAEKLHAQGTLPRWKVRRREKIPGWTW